MSKRGERYRKKGEEMCREFSVLATTAEAQVERNEDSNAVRNVRQFCFPENEYSQIDVSSEKKPEDL